MSEDFFFLELEDENLEWDIYEHDIVTEANYFIEIEDNEEFTVFLLKYSTKIEVVNQLPQRAHLMLK